MHAYIGVSSENPEVVNEELVSPRRVLLREEGSTGYVSAMPLGLLLQRIESPTGNRLVEIDPNGKTLTADHGLAWLAVLAEGLYQMDLDGPPELKPGWALSRRVFLPLDLMAIQLGWATDYRSIARLVELIRDLEEPRATVRGVRFRLIEATKLPTAGEPWRTRGYSTPGEEQARWLATWAKVPYEWFVALSAYQLDWELLREAPSPMARRLVVMLATEKTPRLWAPRLVPMQGERRPASWYRSKLRPAHDFLSEHGVLDREPDWDGLFVRYPVATRRPVPIWLPDPVRQAIEVVKDLHPIERAALRRVAVDALRDEASPELVAASILRHAVPWRRHEVGDFPAFVRGVLKQDPGHALDDEDHRLLESAERTFERRSLGVAE